jgi:arylformamidase
MDYLDISMPIFPGMAVYKNKVEKQPELFIDDRHQQGGAYETIIKMNLHTGTHIDFPLHMIQHGENSTGFKPETLITPVRVYDLTHVNNKITAADLKTVTIEPDSFILLKTKNSFVETFQFDFVYLAEDAATYLVNQGIRGVGVDGLGVERDQHGHPTHHILMDKHIMILEGLRLKAAEARAYTMIALPLAIQGVDALPVRALLV